MESSSTRQRTLNLLKGDLAFLHFHRQHYTEAIAILSELCLKPSLLGGGGSGSGGTLTRTTSSSNLSSPPFQGWYLLDNWLLKLLKQCTKENGQVNQHVQALLQLIENWILGGRQKDLLDSCREWVDELCQAVGKMDSRMLTSSIILFFFFCTNLHGRAAISRYMESMFAVQVTRLLQKLGDDDGLILEITIKSYLPRVRMRHLIFGCVLILP